MDKNNKQAENGDPFFKQIQQAMKGADKDPLSSMEKDRLWEQIEMDAKAQHPSRTPWRSIAAAIVLLVGIAAMLYVSIWTPQQERSFREMASHASIQTPQKETRLQLGGTNVLEMKGSSEITVGDRSLRVKTGLIDQYDQAIADPSALNTLTVPYGRRSQVTLVDGTKVWLNSGSTLIFPQHFSGKNREVYLYGEGYFDVTHRKDMPFYVHTSQMKVRVLGTQFNISSYADEKNSQTVLVEGSVEVTGYDKASQEQQVQRLEPGQLADYSLSSASLVVSNVDTESYSSWKDGYLLAKNTPLSDIIKKLSRYYDIAISLDATVQGGETFSGRLDMQEDVISVLETVSLPSNLTVKKTERGIMIQQ